MKASNLILVVVLAGASAGAWLEWREVVRLSRENAALRAELDQWKAQSTTSTGAEQQKREQEARKAEAQTAEVLRLRSEVTRLKSGSTEAERLKAENQRLQIENQKSRTAGSSVPPIQPVAPVNPWTGDQFSRDTWAFAGYQTPEAAMISALWSMKEGNPKSYLDGLSPEEQVRMATVWQNKTEAEIAAKHQGDVAKVTGLSILERNPVSATETLLKVRLEGIGREEVVRMVAAENQWKFGGYVRPPAKP